MGRERKGKREGLPTASCGSSAMYMKGENLGDR